MYIGSVLSIMPSGKYYMCWTTNQTDVDMMADELFFAIMEDVAGEMGMIVFSGDDPCDMFIAEEVEFDVRQMPDSTVALVDESGNTIYEMEDEGDGVDDDVWDYEDRLIKQAIGDGVLGSW